MLIELLFTTLVIGLVGVLLYIIQFQKAQTNHSERKEVSQSSDPIELEIQGVSSPNLAYQVKSSGDDGEEPNRGEGKKGPQLQSAELGAEETQAAAPGPNFVRSSPSFQIQSSRDYSIARRIGPKDEKLNENTKQVQSKWKHFKVPTPYSMIAKMDSILLPKTEKEIEYQNHILLTRAMKENLKRHSKIQKSLTSVTIYQLNLRKISSSKTSQINKFEFGKSSTGSYVKNEKVIMMLGATGSGKTTLINSLINYVFGVDYVDGFRFKLVTEDGGGGGNQAYSQTSWITAYTIHHQKGFVVPYTLTIVDTPGFGDTGGIERDTQITKQIHKFFTVPGKDGIDHIDTVGFVAQSSLPRLTFTQKYIFDQILSLFGKDIGENIYLMLTFADGKVPQVLNGIKEARLPYQEFFKFNNSVIFDDNTAEDEFATMFWKMGMRSFEKCFMHFSSIKPKSLTLTKSVLEERERIETQIEGLQSEIKRGLNKLEQLKKEVEVVEQHKADLARNEDFKYTVVEDIIVKHELDPGTYVTNCLTCNVSCHHPCSIPDDGLKYICATMDGGGKSNAKCKVCIGRCNWEQHRNMGYYFTTERREVTKTSEDLKRRYLDASGKVMSANEIIEKMVDKFEAVQIKIVGITEVLRKSINKLNDRSKAQSYLNW